VGTGQFEKLTYKSGTALYLGDILVTCVKGHTVVVTSGATRAESVPIASPTVKNGSRGANAKLLQQNLNACGYRLEEDGIFGKLSTQALKEWQAVNGLVVDGIYGKKSEAKMKALLN
jgi:peptidoglycan hydrolase-like protein with peptidoglycan-binding domain